jgi:hypothetical protein
VQCSPRLMGEKLRKREVFLSGTKVPSLSSTSRAFFTLNSFHKAVNKTHYMEILNRLHEPVGIKKLWPNDWIFHHDNALTHKTLSVKQFLAQNRLIKRNTHPFHLIWLRVTSGCFLKGTKILGYWRHLIKGSRWHWKLLHIRSSKNVSNSGRIVGLSA